jgi:exoribonuclease R
MNITNHMPNKSYNDKYEKIIEPLYGLKRNKDMDEMLILENASPSIYSISDRIDMTDHATYSIDPDGCEDADDAFSIYEEDDHLFLAIHIADPTEHININSTLWTNIETNIVTRYPSLKPPIHMMPHEIMERSSLMVNKYGDEKIAITIITEINNETHRPVGKIRLLYTNVKVEKQNALSYKLAGNSVETNPVIATGLKISKALQDMRSQLTRGVVLNELSNSYPKPDNDSLYLYSDTPQEIAMKQMIAEFAIFANSFVGEYLKINYESTGLFRACAAKEWLETVYVGITGQELLNEIIVNGIQAEYISTVSSHDLVGAPEYCHFTSPIRRLSDCVCHYLLKYIHLRNIIHDLPAPFTNDQLTKYSTDCLKITKAVKNIQYKDTKFRLVQTIHSMLCKNEEVNIGYYVSSYTGAYLNIIISKINNHSVYLSYTLQIYDLQAEYIIKQINYIPITKVKCIGKFDEGSIPDLDVLFL